MSSAPLVSICCITYNHEKYIAQAIDSFLIQETDFDVEIVIGDDCSTDNTPLIIEAYRNKFPEKFRILKRTKNLGSEVNFIKTIEACRGTYIALCEGDDYWTDPNKLKLQVSALAARPESTVCVTKYSILNENDNNIEEIDAFENEENISSEHIILKKNIFEPFLFQTHTILFKKEVIRKKLYSEQKCGDVFLAAELLSHGTGIYLPFNTGVYRIHAGGMFSQKSTFERYRIEYIRSKAMDTYFRTSYPEIRQLHRWNRQKLLNSLGESSLSNLQKWSWYFKLILDKKKLRG